LILRLDLADETLNIVELGQWTIEEGWFQALGQRPEKRTRSLGTQNPPSDLGPFEKADGPGKALDVGQAEGMLDLLP